MKEENIGGLQTKFSSDQIVGEFKDQESGITIKNPCKFVNNKGELMMAPISPGIEPDTTIFILREDILFTFEVQPVVRKSLVQQFSNIIFPTM